MKKQVLFAHSGGAQDRPGEGSYDLVRYLKDSLNAQFEIKYPVIRDPEAPTYEMWEEMFAAEFAGLKERVILTGHSLGGSMLLKFMSENKINFEVKALCLVSTPHWGEENWDIGDFKLRKDFSLQLPVIPAIHLFHCIDDPVVPFNHLDFYRKNLPAAVVHQLNGSSHAFNEGLPELAETIKKLKD